jgi:uncharacterized membrane protein
MRSRSVRARALILTVGLALGLGACGGGTPPPSSCPNDVPATCPTPAPTFAADVAPILQQRCGACHVAGGVESTRPFQAYADVQRQKTDILFALNACFMPPADQPQLTTDERHAILGWLVCGAMNN